MRYDLMWCTFCLGLLDVWMLPAYLIATIHPWHIGDVFVKIMMTSRINYASIDLVESGEETRRDIVLWLAGKTLLDIIRYFIMFPLNMLSLYFLPLFLYIKNHSTICLPEERTEQALMKYLSARFIEDLKNHGILKRAYDYHLPSKFLLSIQKVNEWYIYNIPLFLLMLVTPVLNPYRTYQFFFARGHSFVHYTYLN